MLRAKDQEVWDAQRELENKVQVIAGMEEAKKKKKNVECVQCLQKDAEIKGLGAKVDKVLIEVDYYLCIAILRFVAHSARAR